MLGFQTLSDTWLALWDPLAYVLKHGSSQQERPWHRPVALKPLEKIRESAQSGPERSVFRGHGLDLMNLRDYQQGDDVRKIDWNVFARTFSPYIREYYEERQQTLWWVLDVSPSMWCGQSTLKVERLYQMLEALLPWFERYGHRVGALWFDGIRHELVKPAAGRIHVQTLLRRFAQFLAETETRLLKGQLQPDLHCDDALARELSGLSHGLGKSSMVFCLSDFLVADGQALESVAGKTGQRAQMVYGCLVEAHETHCPVKKGLLSLVDPESGQRVWLDTDSSGERARVEAAMGQYQSQISGRLSRTGRWVWLRGEEPLEQAIAAMLFPTALPQVSARGGRR